MIQQNQAWKKNTEESEKKETKREEKYIRRELKKKEPRELISEERDLWHLYGTIHSFPEKENRHQRVIPRNLLFGSGSKNDDL